MGTLDKYSQYYNYKEHNLFVASANGLVKMFSFKQEKSILAISDGLVITLPEVKC